MMARAFLVIVLALLAAPVSALPIEIVKSPQGIIGWLVEDHSVPVVSIQFAFRGGVEQDPTGAQGLSAMLADMMTEGAGRRDAAQYQQALADHGIAFGLSSERDVISGALRALRADLPVAAGLACDALLKPRFEQADLDRVRRDHTGTIKGRLSDPEWQARRAMFTALFPGHPYAMRSFGTEAGIAAITRQDLRQEHRRRFARDNLLVAAAGDITPATLGQLLDRIFGALPAKAELRPVADIAAPDQGSAVHIHQDGGQSVLLFAAPGIKRDDPDWHAAVILNYALGGGGFSSRLMDEVRDRRGLTYSIGTSLSAMDHAGIIIGQASTANAKAGEAWDTARAVWRRTAQDGITAEELAGAQSYLIGSLPTQFTSTGAIAGALVDLQQENLPPDYLDRRAGLFNAVTLADVARVAQRLLDPSRLTLVAVGNPQGIQFDRAEKFVEE